LYSNAGAALARLMPNVETVVSVAAAPMKPRRVILVFMVALLSLSMCPAVFTQADVTDGHFLRQRLSPS